MNCSSVRNRLSAYLDQELGQKEAILVSRHIEACEACRQELAALKNDAALLRSSELPEQPAFLVSRTMAEVRVRVSSRIPVWRRVVSRRFYALAASVLLAVGVVWFGAWIGTGLARLGNGPAANGELLNGAEPGFADFAESVLAED